MKRILMGTKGAHDMTSFLRAWGIFTRPEMRAHCMPVRQPDNPNWVMDWTYYKDVDVIYLHRPCNVMDFEIVERANAYGIPLWVDLDDDLQSITQDNPVFTTYAGAQAKEIIETAIRCADVLTCGGAVHQERLTKEYDREVILIPGSVDDDVFKRFGKIPAHRTGNSIRMSWRGSESHRIDLLYYQDALARQISREGAWRFFGFKPYHLDWKIGAYRYDWLPATRDLFDFYKKFTDWNADVQFVGLLETEFNRVKSNLAWTDGTIAGSVVVAPFLPEYDRPGVIHYEIGNVESAYQAIEKMRHSDDRASLYTKSVGFIREHLLSSIVNEKRIEILRRF